MPRPKYDPQLPAHVEPDKLSKRNWPAQQEKARAADPRPSEEIIREDRDAWPDYLVAE